MDPTIAKTPGPKPPMELAYAPPEVWYRQKRFHRLLLLGAMLMVLASSIHWAPPVARRIQVIYWQHRCLDDFVPLDAKWNAWNELADMALFGGKHKMPPLFIGQLHNETGQRKLVYIGDGGNDLTFELRSTVLGCVVEPGNLLQEPRVVFSGKWNPETFLDNLLPAKFDPNDASHLILQSEHTGHILDVWLRGEKLIVEPREPLLSQSLTSQPSP